MAVRAYRFSLSVISVFLLALLCTASQTKTIYVDDDATGANNGTSWQDAYTFLQDALSDAQLAEKPVEIRVAQGTYKPNQGLRPLILEVVDGRTESYITKYPAELGKEASFSLINDVTVKGGYAGSLEPDPNLRDIELYETVLSGDLDGDDMETVDSEDLGMSWVTDKWWYDPNRENNTKNIVSCIGTDEKAILDGFTITGGSATYDLSGGGMHIDVGSPTVSNCRFEGNLARSYGGGMYCGNGSNPTLTNCTFILNGALSSPTRSIL